MSHPTKLWNRNFTILWLGLVQSYLGDAFLSIGLMWLALEMTGSPVAAATLLALNGIPKLLGPLAGAVVDQVNKRTLMIVVDLIRGLLLVGLFVANCMGSLQVWELYVLVVALSLCGLFYGPSLRVIMPTLVPDEALQTANSILQGGLQIATIAGTSLAGIALALFGSPVALLVDGISFLIAACALQFVTFPPELLQTRRLQVRTLVLDMQAGLRYIFTTKQVLLLTTIAFALNLVLSPINIIFPVFSEQVLMGGVTGFGLLASAIAVGLLLGNMIMGVIGNRLTFVWSIMTGLIGLTLMLVCLSFTQSLWLALILTAALGMMAPIIQVPLVSQLQCAVPRDYQGRVFGTIETVITISLPLAALLAGGALVSMSIPLIFRIAAVGTLLVACLWMALNVTLLKQAEPPLTAEPLASGQQ